MNLTDATAPVRVADASTALDVLALNSGSSSLKYGLCRASPGRVDMLQAGAVDSVEQLARRLAQDGLPPPAAIGHRIVHGGPHLQQHAPIDARLINQLEAAVGFAPLHIPASLAVLRQASRCFPGVPQVACFDTVFHAGLPDVARVLPLPRALRAEGIHRYGFHGLSCASIVQQFADGGAHGLPERLVIAHLGHGASITAVRDGRSVDTSMGLTPSGGLPMGTRCGDIDPGVLLYLLREKHLDAVQLAELLDRRSGLLGISGVSDDLRRLHAAAAVGDAPGAAARLAIAIFCRAVAKQVAGMATALDGIDTLVFTGGIGEHDPVVRAAICRGLAWFGLTLDDAHNRAEINPISDTASRCVVLVLPSQEDTQIARHAWHLVEPDEPR